MTRTCSIPLVALALSTAACRGEDPARDTADPPPYSTGLSCEDPIDYTFPLDTYIEGDDLFIGTPGGPVRTVIGPWGAHASPHTGHFEGNGKSDWAALFADAWEAPEMVRLDGPGACTKGDLCGVHIDTVTSRLPAYIAPTHGFQITKVALEEVTDSHELDRFKWDISGRACPYMYGLGHVGRVGADLRQALIDRGFADPDTVAQVGVLFEDYDDPILLDRADEVGIPQVRYEDIEGHPGYLRGWGGVGATPWAQIEYTAFDTEDPSRQNQWGAEFRFMTEAQQAELEDVLFAEGDRPESFKYDQPWAPEWLWRSEMVLVATDPFYLDEQGSLFSRFGGWIERYEGACEPWVGESCDETMSIFPIHKTSPFYDAGLYDSAQVEHLVIHREGDQVREGEVLTSPVDEVSGTLTLKWRRPEDTAGYQHVSYRVLTDPARMVLVKGAEADTLQALDPAPAVPSDDSGCDRADTSCFGFLGFAEQTE